MATTFRQLRTADGRILEYLLGGAPAGRPLLFHVGTPGAATDFSAVNGAAAELGLQLICYSRPGYGESTAQPGRSVADAVRDISALLDEVGAAEFLAFGWSGGGPHALACAALLPDRCQAAATLASIAPHNAHGLDFLAGMAQANLDEFAAAFAGPAELEALLGAAVPELANVSGSSMVAAMAGLLPPEDQAVLTGPLAEELAASFRRAMLTGPAGWRDDDLAFVRDWGFACADISVPVSIWQGRQDRMVPFTHGQWLAAEIPSAEPQLFATEGHLSLLHQSGAILADLVALADARELSSRANVSGGP